MSSDVVLSSALRSNLLSLQNTQRKIDDTQLRLATGLKVNSALDNPQNFFTAQSLNNRASDLTRLLDGIGQSIRTIEEANNGITALTGLIEQAQSIASEAQSEIRATEGFATLRGNVDLSAVEDLTDSGAITADDDIVISIRTEDDTLLTSGDINIPAGSDVYDLIASINGNAQVGTGNADGPYVRASLTSSGQLKIESLVEGASLRIASGTGNPGIDGFAALGLADYVSTENNGTTAGTRIGGTISNTRLLTSDVSAVGEDSDTGLYYATATLSEAEFVTGYTAGGGDDVDFELDVDGTTYTIGSYNDDTTIQEVVDDINDANIEGVQASFNQQTGRIEIDYADTISRTEFVFTNDDAGSLSFGFGSGALGYDTTPGTTGSAGRLALTAGQIASENITFAGNTVDLARYESDFNNIRDQIDGLVEDASFRGVNLLGGDDLLTFFNEDRSNSLRTQGVDFTANGLGLAEASFVSSGSVTQALSNVENALDEVRNFGTTIANDLNIIQTRRDFTEQTINTLESGADDLTVADQNEEGANLLALQTRQQLGVTSLSLAAQSQQSVLRLF